MDLFELLVWNSGRCVQFVHRHLTKPRQNVKNRSQSPYQHDVLYLGFTKNAFGIDSPNVPWIHRAYLVFTAHTLNSPHVPWSHRAYLVFTAHTLNSPHVPWSHRTYLETARTLDSPHVPWIHRTYLEFTARTLNSPHVPWIHRTYLGSTERTFILPQTPLESIHCMYLIFNANTFGVVTVDSPERTLNSQQAPLE
jgi:hypothetical protein